MNAELFARIYSLFMDACLSSIDKKYWLILPALRYYYQYSIIYYSTFLKQIDTEGFIVSVVNESWGFFLVKDLQHCNYHFVKI